MSSYGGNLTVRQRGTGQGQRIQGSLAIISGNRVTLHYGLEAGGEASSPSSTVIPLTERGWVRLEGGRPEQATREDMLRALSDIKVGTES